MSSNDILNGAKIIIDEMEEELKNKTLPRRDKMYLKSNIYMLRMMSNIRNDVEVLKKHDMFAWATSYPKLTVAVLGIAFLISAMVDWRNLAQPLLHSLIKVLTGGLEIPILP